MLNIRKAASWTGNTGPPAVVCFEFSDWDEEHRKYWLEIERDAIDLCYIDPGHDVDVWIETNLRTMVEVWMNWRPLPDAFAARDFVIDGVPNLTRDPLDWLGKSPLACVKQRPSDEQVGRLVENVRA